MISNEDLAETSDRTVKYYVVPNEKTLPLDEALTDPAWRKPRDITDWSNHGTGVACVAAGLEYGVASKSNLYLVKAKNAWQKQGTGSIKKRGFTISALSDAFVHILGEIRSSHLRGKAAVTMSFSRPLS